MSFVIKFLLNALLLYGFVYLPPVREYLIEPFTLGVAELSATIMWVFGADVHINGNIISVPGFSVQILDMCNGVEATLLFWAALLAMPIKWVYKWKGLIIGTVTVHVLNIARIISLIYLGVYSHAWFDFFHLYVWDALIILDIVIVFILWLRYVAKTENKVQPC